MVCRREMSAVFPLRTAMPDYTFCAVVLGHNFDLNFDAKQTAEECNFLKIL